MWYTTYSYMKNTIMTRYNHGPKPPYPIHVYKRRCGGEAVPQKPWVERKTDILLQLLKHADGKEVNGKHRWNTTHSSQLSEDLRRLLKEGLVELTNKAGRHSSYRKLRFTREGEIFMRMKNLWPKDSV